MRSAKNCLGSLTLVFAATSLFGALADSPLLASPAAHSLEGCRFRLEDAAQARIVISERSTMGDLCKKALREFDGKIGNCKVTEEADKYIIQDSASQISFSKADRRTLEAVNDLSSFDVPVETQEKEYFWEDYREEVISSGRGAVSVLTSVEILGIKDGLPKRMKIKKTASGLSPQEVLSSVEVNCKN